MNNIIMVAGATGNLGGKIIDALLGKGAEIRAIVRAETSVEKVQILAQKGVKVSQIDMRDKNAIAAACSGVTCVVSALSGLREVIIDAQKILLEGAIQAKVPRFIPSDYATDFTKLTDGENRNFDLRREFHTHLENASIQATSIFNGAFMELLTGDMPLILYKQKKILYWGTPSVKMDFTTTHNIAAFTAQVALDNNAPRYLRIAGDSLTATEVKDVMSDITRVKFGFFRPGGIGLINFFIQIGKFFGKNSPDLYPAWQGMQYMRDMMEGRAVLNNHDNNRYKEVRWTTIREYLVAEKVEEKM